MAEVTSGDVTSDEILFAVMAAVLPVDPDMAVVAGPAVESGTMDVVSGLTVPVVSGLYVNVNNGSVVLPTPAAVNDNIRY